ncbi:TetR family transcriptional regulator [Philodulcilactobacillus myokoensis]|uniref:TetR family transcriptional regulator n=1 Tax=Philodulcilactobacillus myokoensis TaxID=2929573 RepID=A0A9W6B2F3_9LACO|nr:TetR/AcrR family transcriptional regulator [Philodulcilactobacillus myokoensis]GLB47403.1 TetR family transcriptional regulator [Philodulcilactobacillus myokoensis]
MNQNIAVDLKKLYQTNQMQPGKTKVLIAALNLISKQGYERTSTAQIAREAQVSEGTIFKYFHSKSNLLDHILKPIFKNLAPNYVKELVNDQNLKQGGLYGFLNHFVHNRFEFLSQNQIIINILLSEVMVNDKLREEITINFKKQLLPLINKQKLFLNHFDEIKPDIKIQNIINLMVSLVFSYFIQVTKFNRDTSHTSNDLDQISKYIYNAITK